MAYQQSPGVEIVEKDASAVTVGLSSTIGATVGAFRWGPISNPMNITNESILVETYGKPDAASFPYFFAAANFLSYTNSLWVNRVVGTGALNASSSAAGILIKNYEHYDTTVRDGTNTAAGYFAARYAGVLGSGLTVSIADSGTYDTWAYKDLFTAAPGTSDFAAKRGASNDELHIVVIDTLGKFSETQGAVLERWGFVSKASNAVSYTGDNNYYVKVLENNSQYVYWIGHNPDGTNWGQSTESSIGLAYASLSDDPVTKVPTAATWANNIATLTFASAVSAPYAVGESITVAGIDVAAYNVTNAIVLSCSTTQVTYAVVGTGIAAGATFTSATIVSNKYDFTYSLTGGNDGAAVADAELELGWDTFADTQTYDISLLITGSASMALSKYVVQNIADVRRDCVAFCSITATASGVASPIPPTSTTKTAQAKTFKDFDSTYAVIDTGYKYQFDKYNGIYRWVALNADTAGLCARVDATNDPWFSPAGMIKGQIKSATKLSWNPNKAERDIIYPLGINPIISMVGTGTILFGDKTATGKPSAFDRINVRRLFLVLEKSIANSAKYQLFELNDEITRLQFVASIEPFLRDAKGRRGIDDYRVICDTTNNTPQVIATNNFVGTILVRAKYSINFITLNFTAVGPSVSFELAATV